jgi:hypothetical protein
MRTRTTLALALVILTVLVTATVRCAPGTEPSYQGHTLQYWLEVCATNRDVLVLGRVVPGQVARMTPAPDKECVQAVSAIGTNAIPTLLSWISDPPSEDKHELHLAQFGFAILAERAVPALPALTQIANTNRQGVFAALFCMGTVGPAALPFLEMVSTNRVGQIRATAVGTICTLGTNAMPAVPRLLQCLSDPNEDFVTAALDALRIFLEDERVFAVVTGALNDPRPRIRLATVKMLTQDKAAPFLKRVVDDPDQGVRDQAKANLQELAIRIRTNAPPQ